MLDDHQKPTVAVGIVCFNEKNEVALIRRGQPPREGEWSIPGGRVEWGEAIQHAALRELKEETGLEANLVGLIDVVDGIFKSRTSGDVMRHYVLVDYAAVCTAGTLAPGDDAADARFVSMNDLGNYSLWDETLRIIQAGFAMVKQQTRPETA